VRTYFSVPVFVNAFFYMVEMERDVLTEQRTNIKFLVKLGKSGWEIREMLETVYCESAMKPRTVKSGSTVVCLAAKKKKTLKLFKNQDHDRFFFYIRGVVHHEFSSTASNS
jgi:hypothetical protein